jgi:hypothetical protein
MVTMAPSLADYAMGAARFSDAERIIQNYYMRSFDLTSNYTSA